MTSLGVDTFSGGEITLWIGTFINIHTFRKIDKFLVLSTGNDVGSNKSESLVASDGSSILVIIRLVSGLNDAALDFWEFEASLSGTIWNTGGPCTVRLTKEGWKTWTLISRVTLKPDDCAIVEAATSKLFGCSMFNVW